MHIPIFDWSNTFEVKRSNVKFMIRPNMVKKAKSSFSFLFWFWKSLNDTEQTFKVTSTVYVIIQ